MCGFVGIWNYATRQPVERELIGAMSSAIVHRGPDDEGAHFDDSSGLALGFRRLSIIDLTTDGHQPMCNEDGSIWVVFNGEIYNHHALRQQLERQGHQFRSRSDTEVIIHHYEERGLDFVNDLNGMFSIAIWDSNLRKLILARDRVGKKPLFYFDNGKTLVFGSELKTLMVHKAVPRELDMRSVGLYFSLGSVPEPYSILKGVAKVPSASVRVATERGNSEHRYWDWLEHIRPDYSKSESEFAGQLLELLDDSVRLRMVSDVPLGAFLSGGVDSSAVVASMARQSTVPINTFSIGFEQQEYSELDYARQIAKRYQTNHRELVVTPELLEDVVNKLVWYADEPFGDSSLVPTYYVSKLAREHVTVVLTGDGGDEVFCGYGRYLAAFHRQWLEHLPSFVRNIAGKVGRSWFAPASTGARMCRRLSLDRCNSYALSLTFMPEDVIRSILTTAACEQFDATAEDFLLPFIKAGSDTDFCSQMQYADIRSYLPGDILTKVDRASMACSLEGRCPLLDYRIMEFAATIPMRHKIRGKHAKYLFKQSQASRIPTDLIYRRKMGFGVPIREWFRDDLYSYSTELLTSQRAQSRGLVDQKNVKRLLEQHKSGSIDAATPIWSLLMFELWCLTFLDSELSHDAFYTMRPLTSGLDS